MAALTLDDEQRDYVRRVREAAADLLPLAAEGREGRVNRPLLRAMGELGLLRGLFGGTDEPSARRRGPAAVPAARGDRSGQRRG